MDSHRLVQTLLLIIYLGVSGVAHAQPPIWIDTDASLGTRFRDLDDILALLQVFGPPDLRLRGISTTFGNINDVDRARKELTAMTRRFGPSGLKVYLGADEPPDLGVKTAASAALTQALKRERLTILALGAMTNISTALVRHPELADRITRVIAVAGRRPGDRFAPGKGWVTLRDLNFESDPRAFRVLLEADIPVTLIPFELGNQVWIAGSDLHRMRAAGGATSWFATRAASWLDLWTHAIGVTGFNPFEPLSFAISGGVLLRRHARCGPQYLRARGERWAWWALLFSGAVVFGGYFAPAMYSGFGVGLIDAIGLGLLALVYALGLALAFGFSNESRHHSRIGATCFSRPSQSSKKL